MKRDVISSNMIPTHLPLYETAVAWLLMERFHASQFGWGVFTVIAAVLWGVCVYRIHNERGHSVRFEVEPTKPNISIPGLPGCDYN